jgi:hypothetical protein
MTMNAYPKALQVYEFEGEEDSPPIYRKNVAVGLSYRQLRA